MSKTKKPHIPGLNLDQIIDHLPCCVSIQDRDLRILYVNERFKRDFGDGTGKICHTVYKGSPDICPNCPVQKTFADKQVHVTEQTIKLSDGKISQIFIQTSPILDGGGRVTAVIEMATHISRMKTDRKELITLGQSIALLSHGIKNILTGLEGGMYVTNDEELHRRALTLWSFGETRTPAQSRDYHVYAMGWMYRNNDLTAAFGRAQLRKLDAYLARQRENLVGRRDTLRQALDQQRADAQTARNRVHEIALRVESKRSSENSLRSGMDRIQQQLQQLEQAVAQLFGLTLETGDD